MPKARHILRHILLSLGALTVLAVGAFAAITLSGASLQVMLILIVTLTGMLLWERTRRQVLAARLKTSEERLSFAMQGSKAGLWDWNIETGDVYYSSRWQTMLGYEPGEVQPTLDFWEEKILHPDDKSVVAQAMEAHVNGETQFYEAEYRARTKTGDSVWLLGRGKVVERANDGSPLRMVGTQLDVSERKRLEEQLGLSEERLKFAIDGSNIGVWDHYYDTGETFYNERWFTMLGYEPGEIEGGSGFFESHVVHPDYRPRFERAWADHMEGRTPSYETELQARTKTGEWIWILARGKIVSRDENNAPLRVVGTHVDINERKQMEAELEKVRHRMEEELNVGREIQMSMLPLIFPPYPRRREFDVFARLVPAREVGGDFYDFFFIDDDHFCMCVGDVSGKGVPAALFMAVTKTLINSRASNDYSPASILTHVNNEISANNDASMFVTIFLGILNLDSGELLFSNAGHNPPYIRRANGELVRLDQRHGPVIGAVEEMVYGQAETVLEKEDMLFAYTDGVTEAMDEEQHLYQEQRLARLLSNRDSSDAEEAVLETLADVQRFQGQAEQADDITILATTYYGKPEGAEGRVLDLVLVNRLEEIERANGAFNAFAEAENLAVPTQRSINLVLDELLSNIITFAFEDDEEHAIDVRIELSSDRLSVTFADDGVPFNPFSGSPPDTALSVEDREIGGLGVHVVRNVMDEVSYNRRTDRNVVILVKYLDDRSGE